MTMLVSLTVLDNCLAVPRLFVRVVIEMLKEFVFVVFVCDFSDFHYGSLI